VKCRRKPASYELELHFDFTLKTGPIPKEMRSLHSLRIEEEHWWIGTLDCTSPGAEEATGIQFCPSKFSYHQLSGSRRGNWAKAMNNGNHEHEKMNQADRAEQQERHSRHDSPGWIRKYLDLADQAINGGGNEDSSKR
jgi:hypothetical protein